MNVFRIPLVPTPQTFGITLAGRALVMTVQWNGESPAWEMDIADGVTGEVLFLRLPIVTGVDLFAQYRHLVLGGALAALNDGTPGNPPPNLTDLGIDSQVYFLTSD